MQPNQITALFAVFDTRWMHKCKPKSDNSLEKGLFLFLIKNLKKLLLQGVSNGCGQRQNLCRKPVCNSTYNSFELCGVVHSVYAQFSFVVRLRLSIVLQRPFREFTASFCFVLQHLCQILNARKQHAIVN